MGVERKNTMGKGRARDLLRKHYGLGVGPPQPLSGPGKPLDPMDIGEYALLVWDMNGCLTCGYD